MREILFRGKRTDNSEWVYGCVLQADNRSDFSVIYDYDGSMYEPPLFDFDSYEVIPETIGQYTGLKDKNGKRIFEGDILRVITGNGWSCPKGTKVYYEVVFTEFNEECADWAEYIGFMAKRGEHNLDSIHYIVNSYGAEVIGNVTDNSELLKGE